MADPGSQQGSNRVSVNRPLVGVISLTCFAISVGLWMKDPRDQDVMLWRGGLMRAGTLMAALWIALPTKTRPAAWANVSIPMLLAGVASVVFVASRPKVFLVLLPIGIAIIGLGLFFRPRPKSVNRPDRSTWRR